MTQTKIRGPGWDARAIRDVAKRCYAKTTRSGYREMFEHHGWPERGPKMMPSVQAHVVERYGSVELFAQRHRNKRRA